MKSKFLTPLIALALLGGCTQIDAGERGVETAYGAVSSNESIEPGLHIYNPISTSIHAMSVQQIKETGHAHAYTKDIQTANVEFVATFHLDPAHVVTMYKSVGKDWNDAVVPQRILQQIKNEFGRNDAVDLISQRQAATNRITMALSAELLSKGVILDGFDLTNISYDSNFENAIEAKQVAVQNAIKAQNQTVEIAEQGKQTVIRANAEAEAMAVRGKALSENAKLVEYTAVQKWDGHLPQYQMGGATPFINLNK